MFYVSKNVGMHDPTYGYVEFKIEYSLIYIHKSKFMKFNMKLKTVL